MSSSPRSWSIAAVAFVGVLVALALTATTASAATGGSTEALTICPALGTVPVMTAAGERACVQNDCASIERAMTGGAADCSASTVRQTTFIMSQDYLGDDVPAAASAPAGSLPPVAVADPTTDWQTVTIRSLVALGTIALLLAGGLLIATRRIPGMARPAQTKLGSRPAEAG